MRAIDCACGEHLEAESDEALEPKVRDHVQRVHPDMQMDDEQVRAFVSDQSHEVATA